MQWFEDILRNLFYVLDKLVYLFINLIYQLFISLSQINISQDIVENFASRIYALLGIFMLFRLAFSLITYLINPDNVKDQQKGAGALVKRIFISIMLMALVPTIFREAFELQKIILEENILGQVILGTPKGTSSNSTMSDTGKEMAFTVFSAFFHPEHADCEIPFSNGALTSECRAALGDSIANDYEKGYKDKNVGAFDSILNSKDSNGDYIFHYQAAISTIAGGFVAWIIMLFCIDISLRVVKLAFLQIISPVPIISYIDPKGADGMFKKWYTTCFKTYADVFVRLAAIYFSIYMISLLTEGIFEGNAFTVGYNGRSLTLIETAFVILGILMFAKQLPDLLKDLLGIDLKGDFTLNPMKKLSNASPLATAAIGMGAGAVGGLVGNIAASAKAYKGQGILGGLHGLKHAVGGVFTGAARGARAGYDSKGDKLFSSSWSAAGKGGENIVAKADAKEEGVRFRDKVAASVNTAIPWQKTASERTEEKLKNLDKVSSSYKAIKDRAKSEFIKGDYVDKGALSHYNSVKNQLELLKSRSIDRNDYGSDKDYMDAVRNHADQITKFESALVTAENACIESYVDNAKDKDAVIQTNWNDMQRAVSESDFKFVDVDKKTGKVTEVDAKHVNFKQMKDTSSSAETETARIRVSDDYRRDTAATNYVNRNGNNGSNKK